MIIKFPSKEDLEGAAGELKYTTYTDLHGDLGVSTLGREISICQLNKKEFLVGKELISREELSEFLWVAAIFVDSQKKHYPTVDLVGCDYPE